MKYQSNCGGRPEFDSRMGQKFLPAATFNYTMCAVHYSALRKRNGAWFDTQLQKVSAVTNIYLRRWSTVSLLNSHASYL
jgi:hypothetical protein